MSFDRFSKKKVGDKLSVGYMDRLSAVARRVEAGARGSFQNQQLGGSVNGTSQPAPFIQTLVEITNEQINTSDKRDSGLYLCRPLWGEKNTRSASLDDVQWDTVDKEWELDATATETVLAKGDRISAYWHQQRGMFIPLVNDVAPVYFKLRQDLNEGSPAKAYILSWYAKANKFIDPETTLIEVQDFRPQGFEAPKGTRGVALPRTGKYGKTVYEIVDLFWKARFIEFQLTADLTRTSEKAKASVVRYWDGINPERIDYPIRYCDIVPLEVHNSLLSNGVYQFEGEGESASYPAKGYAVYDEHDDIYRIWVMKNQDRDLSAKAQYDWQENNGKPRVEVKLCNDDGTIERGDKFWVGLPRLRDVAHDNDPSVYKNDIIRWSFTKEGNRVCESEYLKSKIGDLKWQKGTDRIETGWVLCNGDDETWDVKGRVLMAYDPDDAAADGSETTPGDDVGFRWHGDTENNHPDHDNHRHAIHVDNSDTVDAGTDGSDLALAGNPLSHIWTSGVDDLDGEADGKFLEHLGPDGEDNTDNRQLSKVAVLIERFK